MKILLFGEFSGLHTNLKYGLKELGHEVTLVSNGDGGKQIGGADIYIRSRFKNRYLGALVRRLRCAWVLPGLKGYDIVQYIAPFWLPLPRWVELLYLRWMKKNNARVFYNACGDDPFIIVNMVTLRYSPFHSAINAGEYGAFCRRLRATDINYALKAYDLFDGIIASSYMYQHSSSRHWKYFGYVPFPAIKIPELIPYPRVDGVIKIFFGYTRPAGKGASYILDAFERVREKYRELVQIDVVSNVPYSEYVTLFDDCHIFIDQASSYEYAMNALFAMVKGKVVLSGCEPEQQALFDRPCPVVNILPDADDIFVKICHLIDNRVQLESLGRANYDFVKAVHDPMLIAQRYLDKWGE